MVLNSCRNWIVVDSEQAGGFSGQHADLPYHFRPDHSLSLSSGVHPLREAVSDAPLVAVLQRL